MKIRLQLKAIRLLRTIVANFVLADKAYNSKEIVAAIEAMGGKAIIPSISTRKEQREIDKEIYKARNRIERFFSRIKEFRRIAPLGTISWLEDLRASFYWSARSCGSKWIGVWPDLTSENGQSTRRAIMASVVSPNFTLSASSAVPTRPFWLLSAYFLVAGLACGGTWALCQGLR